MKIALICRSFDKNSGQGIYKMAEYLYESLKNFSKLNIQKIESKSKNFYYFDLIDCPKNVLNNDFDIYHFLMPEVCLPILLSEKIRKKSIVTLHDTIIYKIKERKWLSEKYIKLMNIVAKRAKIIITPSNQSKRDLINLVKIPKEKIFVIPWGVDLNIFKQFKPQRKKRSKIIVGYLGGLGKRKNVEWIIKVAKYFKDKFIFKIAGIGPELRRLKILKKNLKVRNVKFIGFVPEKELPKFYNSLNVFIFPSSYEGFGIPLVEAMACEVPYIIGMNTGIAEILPIYKISCFTELKKILTKIKNGEIKPLKNQRRWLVKNSLTWKSHVRQLIKIYERI